MLPLFLGEQGADSLRRLYENAPHKVTMHILSLVITLTLIFMDVHSLDMVEIF